MRAKTAHILAAVGTLLGWFSLALQLIILIHNFRDQGRDLRQAVWQFFGYFTILTNILVAIVLSHATLRPEKRTGFGNAHLRLSVATAIVMVGIVYSVALREIWNPQGWQKLADVILHDVAPILFLVFCLLCGTSNLRLRDAVYALILPFVYVVYAFARGALDGWYPYYFLDPTKLSIGELALNAVGLFVAFWIVAMVIIKLATLAAGRARTP